MTITQMSDAREAKAIREINELHAVQEKAIDRAIRIGELLTECQESHKGNFVVWLAENVKFSERTAYNYITTFKQSKFATVANEPKTVREAIKPKKSAATTIIGAATGKAIGGSQKRKLKAAGIDVDAKLEVGSIEAEEVAAKAAVVLDTTVVTRADLSLTMQQKYDKALAKALVEQKAAQETIFWKEVNKKALEVMPDRMRKIDAENKVLQRDWNNYLLGPGAFIKLDEYRKVLSVLHPDKQPTDAERGEAFHIVRKLDPYVQATNRK